MAGDPRSDDDDPWTASAGYVGAAPPPAWGQDQPAPGGTLGQEAGDDEPPPRQAAPQDQSTGTPTLTGSATHDRTHHTQAAGASDDPYWSPAFSRSGQQFPSGGSRYRYRRQVTFRRNSQFAFLRNAALATGPRFWLVWGAISVVTVGLASPIPTIIAWVRAEQARRRPDVLGAASRFWKISAIIWTVITALVLVGYIAAGGNSGSGTSSYQPPAIHYVALHAPAWPRRSSLRALAGWRSTCAPQRPRRVTYPYARPNVTFGIDEQVVRPAS